jgi:predicted membrane protein
MVKTHGKSRVTLGIALIVVGALLAALNFNVLPAKAGNIIYSWQMLLIVIGTVSLFRRHVLSGVILIVIGCFLMVPRLGRLYPESFPAADTFVSIYWPLLLVFAGILVLVFRACGKRHRAERFRCMKSRLSESGKQYPVNEDFRKVNVFGYGEYFVMDTEFNGGTLTAVFGGMEVDLRKAVLPEGDTYLKVEMVFSGLTLFISEEWTVDTQIEVVAGGIEDRRKGRTDSRGRRLIIFGSVVFSGIEIKN